jgi:hypothetical protein
MLSDTVVRTILLLVLVVALVSSQCTLTNSVDTSGDGYMPLFGANRRVFNSYHHSDASVMYIDPIAGTAGAPIKAQGNVPALSSFYSVRTANAHEGQLMINQRFMYFAATTFQSATPDSSANTVTWGVLCFDTLNNKYCSTSTPGDAAWLQLGTTTAVFGGVDGLTSGFVANPTGTNQYLMQGPDRQLACFSITPSTGVMSSCTSSTISSTVASYPAAPTAASAPEGSILRVFNNQVFSVFVHSAGTQVIVQCWDMANNGLSCPGFRGSSSNTNWNSYTSSQNSLWNTYFGYIPNVAGTNIVPEALCWIDYYNFNNKMCVWIDTGAGGTIGSQIASGSTYYTRFFGIFTTTPAENSTFIGMLSSPTVINTTMYWGRWTSISTGDAQIRCWDWLTNAECNAPLVVPNDGNYYYKITQDDDGCLWALSDNQRR